MVPSPQDTHDADSGNPARPVRDEDAFDVDAVASWLRDHAAPDFARVVDGKPEVGILPTGQVVGVVDEIPAVADLLVRIRSEAEDTLKRLTE